MLSAVTTALLLIVMLLTVTSFIISALRERQRHLQTLAQQEQGENPSPSAHGTMILQIQAGIVVGVEKPQPLRLSTFILPSSWYRRRRTLVSASFLLMLLLALFVQSAVADGALQNLGKSFSSLGLTQAIDVKTAAHPQMFTNSPLTASQSIVRVDSADPHQYSTSYQLNVWSFSSCSGIAMEEVMNAYGKHLIASDVLQVEIHLGIWNTYDGLTGGEAGIARTAAYFGFKAVAHPPRTVQDLIAVVSKGFPVIVAIPGHILVVRGGDSTNVYFVDSAPENRTVMTRQQFSAQWSNNHFSVVLTPR